MEKWTGKKVAVLLNDGIQLRGTLLWVGLDGTIKMTAPVGTNNVPSEVWVPEKSYEMVYLVPDEAVFERPRSEDDWAGEKSSNTKIALVN